MSLFTFCSKNKVNKVEYYNNGNIKKEFFVGSSIIEKVKNDNYKSIYNYIYKRDIDSSIIYYYKEDYSKYKTIDLFFKTERKKYIFYKNGKVKEEGVLLNNIKIGKWNFYSDEGKLELSKEYTIIKGESYVNQEWHFNEDQKLTYGGSDFYEIKFDNDTIKVGEEFKAIINLPVPFFKKRKSKILVCIAANDSIDFTSDYSNENEIDKICFKDFETNKVNKKWVSGTNFNHSSVISKKFYKIGKNYLNGYILEYLENQDVDSIKSKHKMYFNLLVFVKPQ